MGVIDILLVVVGIAAIGFVAVLVYAFVVVGIVRHNVKKILDEDDT